MPPGKNFLCVDKLTRAGQFRSSANFIIVLGMAVYTVKTDALETLTFRKGKFVLEECSSSRLRLKLSRNAHWRNIGNDAYETTNLGAAARFREHGDERVEKIFQKTFQAHYSLPRKMPSLESLDLHQRAGVEWILSRKRSYLAHAPGAGKTATAIVAAGLSEGKGQTLFIVPPSLVRNWEREILLWSELLATWPAIGMIGLSNLADSVAWNADFILCPDSMLTKEWVYGKLKSTPWKFIAVDEASRLKEPTSRRSLAFYGGIHYDGDTKLSSHYPGIFKDARHVVLLDGSPMPNRPIELWAPAYALHPEAIDCRQYDDFGYRYCGAKPNERGVWEYKYSSNEAELKEKLTKDFMQVVTEDSLTHPERRRSMVFIDDVRSEEHKTWEQKNLGSIKMEFSENLNQGEIARWRRELGLRKVTPVARYIRERLSHTAESILIFAWHREVCFRLAEELLKWKPMVVVGGVSASVRESSFRSFQEGKTRVLIMNIAAAGRGHNLQRADRVIFAEWSWTDELNRQAEKRASRKGSKRRFVRCEYLVVPNSMDEMVLRSVFTKAGRVKRIIG